MVEFTVIPKSVTLEASIPFNSEAPEEIIAKHAGDQLQGTPCGLEI